MVDLKGYMVNLKGYMVDPKGSLCSIDQVAEQIWVCDHGKVERWKGSIRDYKRDLAKKMGITI
eukprot:33066-Pyramimonas_sp.AAC.1